MSTIIARNCFGVLVAQEEDNGYINITKLAKAYQKQTGKRREASEWLSNKRTKESINHLNSVTGIPVTALIEVRQGGYKKVSQSWSALFKWISFSQRLLAADRPDCKG